ncbi:MarR family winged helix-turn-helix transcriptional regulator [Microbacterium sp. NPDC089696]|uniref:MarR family winged helix-turn-helix transcriptional regulator n=1 Tax=Microbacterium sp. NPDC089696 TaxID=3364199 RepID=UPI0037FA6697
MDEGESRAWVGLTGVLQLLPAALEAQLQRDAKLTHFEFVALSVLRFAPGSTVRMSALATATDSSLTRLSHVCSRLEKRGLVERFPSPQDKRATDIRLSAQGRRELVLATPNHIANVRRLVIDVLTPEQLESLADITETILAQLVDDADCEAEFAGV